MQEANRTDSNNDSNASTTSPPGAWPTKPKIVVTFTQEGLETKEILASDEDEEKEGDKLLQLIRPCLDVADAILRKVNAGPRA